MWKRKTNKVSCKNKVGDLVNSQYCNSDKKPDTTKECAETVACKENNTSSILSTTPPITIIKPSFITTTFLNHFRKQICINSNSEELV